MKALLVRIGVDQVYGGWNSPVDPDTGAFVYTPIPEKSGARFQEGLRRPFSEVLSALETFAGQHGLDIRNDLKFPAKLTSRSLHLDPDFDYLSYGDNGDRRGSGMIDLAEDDIIAFYAGLRPIRRCEHKLIYALVALYVVQDTVLLKDIPKNRWVENAHTRKLRHGPNDIIIRAKPGSSGLLERCIPIGEWRNRAYRVRNGLLKAWGGLSVNDGYIQRSAVPPRFLDPQRFYRWFKRQGVRLIESNNWEDHARVVIVHLRRPRRSDPNESRTDPFWEFGSFGCTGCHRKNLMNPKKASELEGVRLAFAQGGSAGFKLVYLSPPITIERHRKCCEARWQPAQMPFRYDSAPLLMNNQGKTDFPQMREFVGSIDRGTWCAKFSSAFRSRRRPLRGEMSAEIVAAYQRHRASSGHWVLAEDYVEAMPYPPSVMESDRKRAYQRQLSLADGRRRSTSGGASSCRSQRKRQGTRANRKRRC